MNPGPDLGYVQKHPGLQRQPSGPNDTAKVYTIPEHVGHIGFISSMRYTRGVPFRFDATNSCLILVSTSAIHATASVSQLTET